MSFYVYKPIGARPGSIPYPKNWQLVEKFDDLAEAEARAIKLSGTKEPYTEPGHNLNKAFFAKGIGYRWAAMIETKDIHSGDA